MMLIQFAALVFLQGCVAGSTGYSTNMVLPGYEDGNPVEIELHLHLRRFVVPPSKRNFVCYYQYNHQTNVSFIPLLFKGKERDSRIYRYGCTLPPLIADDDKLEYYFEFVIQGVTNKTHRRVLTRHGFME